ncbi:MAG: 6-carboxytetrahydropterin synthase, partial [Candidatus Omnitrophica bacterium]|nr:6-carboxytetrahydropterin synthase [Candidatus Omnitrophota bacterium]
MYRISREFHFNYGHRLVNHQGKCAGLHGHNARVQIEISSEKLNPQDMVMDFDKIRETIGAWIEEVLDHKMILCEKDPLVPMLQQAGEKMVLIKENPTAEILARWIYQEARKMRLPVSKITLW